MALTAGIVLGAIGKALLAGLGAKSIGEIIESYKENKENGGGVKEFFNTHKENLTEDVTNIPNSWEEFKENIKEGWENFKEGVSDAGNKIKEGIGNIGDKIEEGVGNIGDKIEEGKNNLIDKIVGGGSSEENNQNQQPTIKDETGANEETTITTPQSTSEWLTFLEEQQKKAWEREDAIRLETQAREDSAYQRSVADALKAGINPNLINISPAQSGGGITQATGMDLDAIFNQLEVDTEKLLNELDKKYETDENRKKEIISGIITIGGTVISLLLSFGLGKWGKAGKVAGALIP